MENPKPEPAKQESLPGIDLDDFTVLDGVRFIGRTAVKRALNILATHLSWGSTTVSEVEEELRKMREEGIL